MPWRLIGFIILFFIFLVFIAFNLGNKCDVSLGFKTFEAVPVYLTSFFSFALGMLYAIPCMISFGFKKSRERKRRAAEGGRKKGRKEEIPEVYPPAAPEGVPEFPGKAGPYGTD